MRATLERHRWSEVDFPEMGWHDATIYAHTIYPDSWEFALDIDYILKWIDPVGSDPHFTFWVAPATLIFRRIGDLQIYEDLSTTERPTIMDISRMDARMVGPEGPTDWLWRIELRYGEITFRAHGFDQFFRQDPIHTSKQALSLQQRGGISFARSRE